MACRLVNVLIVSTESLPTVIDSSLKEAREEAVRYILFHSSLICIDVLLPILLHECQTYYFGLNIDYVGITPGSNIS